MLFYLDDLPVLFPYDRLVARIPSLSFTDIRIPGYTPVRIIHSSQGRQVTHISRVEQYQYMADLKKTLDAGVRLYEKVNDPLKADRRVTS